MLPLLTAALPGTGGAIKVIPEDFRVDELCAYTPCGEGAHLFVRVEKRGRTTPDVARELARALGADERSVGWAGLKDAQSVATQWISVPGADAARALGLEGRGWRVLEAARHANKLRPGHLAGNRFRVRVRGVGPDALPRARAVLDALAALGGAPSYFGEQRFGRDGSMPALGRALLGKGEHAQLARARRDRFLRKLALSALQAALFNAWLAARIADGLFAYAVDGDVLKKRHTGGLFVCTTPAADSPRVAAGEIDPTGPIFGHKMMAAQGEEAAREARLLAAAGLALEDFRAARGEALGTRRPARAPLGNPCAEEEPGALVLSFTLPPGCYATSVLREVTKAG